MSAYQFAPAPDLSTNEQTYATWENGFTDEELNRIVTLGESLTANLAVVNDAKTVDLALRKARTAWIALTDNSQWLYDRLTFIARKLNGQFFDFDLYGFVEDFQFTIYGNDRDHYTWHMDKGVSNAPPRKLSLVLQLSDPATYEGGDLELMYGATITTAAKQRGLVYAFPSWIMHRVTPVTRGVRKTLVVWISGPKFK